MKRNYLIAGITIATVPILLIFLALSYSTMYKQNHAIPILEYHNIAKESASSLPWTVSLDEFCEQISYLNQNCNVVSLKSLLDDIQQRKPIPGNTIAITFDDGYISNYTLAYPILKKYNTPATIFIIVKAIETGRIGSSETMNWSQLQEMINSGLIDIESHTYDLHHLEPSGKNGHMEPAISARFRTSNGTETEEEHAQRLEDDLIKSSQIIKTKLGTKPVILSWPFGASEKEVISIAKQAGFFYTIGQIGYNNPRINTENIGRIVIPGNIDLETFKNLVNPQKITYSKAISLELELLKHKLLKIIK